MGYNNQFSKTAALNCRPITTAPPLWWKQNSPLETCFQHWAVAPKNTDICTEQSEHTILLSAYILLVLMLNITTHFWYIAVNPFIDVESSKSITAPTVNSHIIRSLQRWLIWELRLINVLSSHMSSVL